MLRRQCGLPGFLRWRTADVEPLLDGEFVKFASPWPTEVTTTVEVEVEVSAFVAALKQVSLRPLAC